VIPTVLVVGASGSGKTTLIERMVPVLRGRGLVVGTVKHASRGFEVDQAGNDSARHFGAGSATTLVVGPDEQVLFRRVAPEPLAALVARFFEGCDVVLAEGFSWELGPRVLVHRRGVVPKPLPAPDVVLLAVTDEPLGYRVEVRPDEVGAVVDAIVAHVDGRTDDG